jgi:hypothetical protein
MEKPTGTLREIRMQMQRQTPRQMQRQTPRGLQRRWQARTQTGETTPWPMRVAYE